MSAAVTTVDNSTLLQNYINQQKALAANSSSTSSSNTATSISRFTGDFNTFLKILTTQLQNQDPLNAMDSNEFTRQLVQFSGVEQQINTNSKLDQLLNIYKGNGITPLLNYVGKYVETSANGQIVVQGGESAFSYKLPGTASKVTITITDNGGNVIATMNGPTASGVNKAVWDGTGTNGSKALDGIYKIKITANDSNGKTLAVSDIRMVGKVTSIQTGNDGTTTLSVGGITVKAEDITAVYSGGNTSA